MSTERACRFCKCTESTPCNDAIHGPCAWVIGAGDCCSSCYRALASLQRYDSAAKISEAIHVSRTAIYNWAAKRPDELRTKKKSGHLLFHSGDCLKIHSSPRRPGRKVKA